MTSRFPRKADFAHQPLVGFYEPETSEISVTKTFFGLVLEGTWFYGIFQNAEGRSYAIVRKAVGYTTRDIAIMASDEVGMRYDPRTTQATIGGKAARVQIDGYDITSGSSQARGTGFEVRVGETDFEWSEHGPQGDILQITGKRAAPGFQVYVPWRVGRDEAGEPGEPGALLYTSTLYFADGTLFGEPVSGFFAVDQSYLPHGVDWNNSAIWMRLQGAWNVFANEYADGSLEWGHISVGADRFKFAAVASSTDVLVDSRSVDAVVHMRDLDFADRVEFKLDDGDHWEFVTHPNGPMIEFSAARPGWSGHCGVVRRVGESRPLKRSWGWQELFPGRI